MDKILLELNSGNTVLLETERLPEFWEYCMKQKDYHSFRYEYSEKLVKITLNGKDTIIKSH